MVNFVQFYFVFIFSGHFILNCTIFYSFCLFVLFYTPHITDLCHIAQYPQGSFMSSQVAIFHLLWLSSMPIEYHVGCMFFIYGLIHISFCHKKMLDFSQMLSLHLSIMIT